MTRTLLTAAAIYLLYDRQRRIDRRLSQLEQEWRAVGLAAEQAAARIEHLDWDHPREEGAR